jgi:hypothetical protein
MSDGEILKAFIKGKPNWQMGDIANKLGMSRQNLNYHLRKDILDADFERLIKEKLKIERTENGFSIAENLSGELNQVHEDFFMEVPVLTVYSQAGYLRANADSSYLKGLEKMLVPKEYDKGKYLVVEVTGDSMDDGTRRAICEGDKLLIKELDRSHWKNKLHFRKALFVVCTKEEGVVCKEIIAHDVENGVITCHSWNPLYDDYTVNLQDQVIQLFYVKKMVERRINL